MNHVILVYITFLIIPNVILVSSFHSTNKHYSSTKFYYDHTKVLFLKTSSCRSYSNSIPTSTCDKRWSKIEHQCNPLLFLTSNDDLVNEERSRMENINGNFKFQNELMSNGNEIILDDTTNSIVSVSDGNGIKKEGSNNSYQLVSGSSNEILWDVYICQLKNSKERGADATLGAFIGLAPQNKVMIHTSYIHKSKGKGPTIRCIQRAGNVSFEVNNVDSVDKVYTILTKYMNLKNIDPSARECFKYNYKGNSHLDKNEITQAITCYNKAISTGYKNQEGIILVMRATAYLQRAFHHRNKLKTIVSELDKLVPKSSTINNIYGLSKLYPKIGTKVLYPKMIDICRIQDTKFQQIKYRHGLYENALLHATKDSLRATQLLPNYAKTWLRAGDSLAELRKYKESATYYEKALELDDSLEYLLVPMIKELEESQVFLDNARASGWSDDTLRISLDVAG